MPKKPVPDAWTLYRSMFKDGDEVVLITYNDDVVCGRVFAKPKYARIERRDAKARYVDWDEIRFISHDGFPVKKLMGADGSETIEDADTTDLQEIIRFALTTNYCNDCGEYFLLGDFHHHLSYRDDIPDREGKAWCDKCHAESMTFGDPFVIEDVHAVLLNPGNVPKLVGGDYDWEEVVVMRAKDGAAGLLYDLPTVYDFATATPHAV